MQRNTSFFSLLVCHERKCFFAFCFSFFLVLQETNFLQVFFFHPDQTIVHCNFLFMLTIESGAYQWWSLSEELCLIAKEKTRSYNH